MAAKNIFYRPVSWILFLLIAAAGVYYISNNFEKANPLVSVNIEMDRQTALDEAARLAEEFNIGPKDYKQAAAFRNDSRFQNFTELEAGGLDTFNTIVSEGYYSSFYWAVRHFKEQEANEVVIWFKPSGESYGFREKIPESEPGAALSQEEALRVAEHHAIYNWDVDLTYYELVEESKTEQLSGRVDHTFVYERTDKSVGEGKFRLKLVVSGDKLTCVDYFVKIPENFDRRYSEMRSANQTIQMISTAAIVLIYGLLGVGLGLFVLIRRRWIIWRPAVYWGIGIALASVFLLTLNSLPFSWFLYDTSTSQSNFLLRQLLSGLMGAVGFGAVMAVSFMAAEGLGRMAFPGHIRWWKLWSKDTGGSLPVLGQTVAGYLFAVVILAIDVLFYVTTTTHFDWWSPAGTLSNPNVLATYLPWLDSIAISLQAGFWEEALFRAVPIAGVFILTKGKKSQNFWIVMVLLAQTLIFGAGHANYPQQPSYARVVEMIVPFTIMGIIYIYYGILPAVIAHYAVDVFWISLPLWVTSESGIWIDRSLVLFFLFLPLLIVFFFRIRNGKWLKVPDKSRNAGWEPPAVEEKEQEQAEIVPEIKKLKTEKWLIPLAVAGLALWIVFSPFKTDSPVLTLKKEEAKEIARNELEARYNLNFKEWTLLSSVEDNVDTRDIFVWRTGDEEHYNELIGKYLYPPHWLIRLVKTLGSAEEKTEEFRVRVNNKGEVINVYHRIPEKAPGKNLAQSEAQQIADAALELRFNLERKQLKEVSVSPEKLDNRTDWEFVYADTINFPLDEGQGRYQVEIAGDEVTSISSFVHIPEEWTREYKETSSKKSIISTIGNVLLIGTILLGLILGIIRWTRKKFNFRIFISFTFIFIILHLLDNLINWSNLISGYSTQVPMGNFVTMMIIGIAISAIPFSLFNGIIVAATPGWIPVKKPESQNNLFYAFGLGLLVAGVWAAIVQLGPKTEPTWINYSYLNGIIPWLGLAVTRSLNILVFPTFFVVLFYGINHYTKNGTSSLWPGLLIALLSGMGIMAIDFESYPVWILSGVITGTFIWLLYYFFIRFHFEWIPISFGILPVIKMVKEIVVVNNLIFTTGGILMIIISSTLLIWWYNLLISRPVQTRHMSPDNEN